MKNFLFIALLIFSNLLSAQCGLYLTQEDYLNKKLTDERKNGFRLNSTVRIYNRGDKSSEYIVDFTKVWGYRFGLTDYRIIDGKPRAILSAGEFYFFGDIEDKFYFDKKEKRIMFSYDASNFGLVSKGINGEMKKSTSYKVLYEILGITDVKAFKKELMDWIKKNDLRSGGLPSEVVDCYNNRFPASVVKLPRYEVSEED
jgi:hypothetical protein